MKMLNKMPMKSLTCFLPIVLALFLFPLPIDQRRRREGGCGWKAV
jgi:hypothetical protein